MNKLKIKWLYKKWSNKLNLNNKKCNNNMMFDMELKKMEVDAMKQKESIY